MRTESRTRTLVLLTITVTLIAVGCSPSGVKPGGSDSLDSAIRLYIDGRHDIAAEQFALLTRELESEDDVRTAYLYLGRCYMALEDYAGAADAFSSGKMLGGGVEFDGYLAAAQQHLRATSKALGAQTSLTRAQLAVLIEDVFGNRLPSNRGSDSVPADMENHWAKAPVARSRAAGVMVTLADGNFHPDAYVTRPSFWVTVRRLANTTRVPEEAIRAYYPNGWRGALEGPSASKTGSWLIAGSEATEILRSLGGADEPDDG